MGGHGHLFRDTSRRPILDTGAGLHLDKINTDGRNYASRGISEVADGTRNNIIVGGVANGKTVERAAD